MRPARSAAMVCAAVALAAGCAARPPALTEIDAPEPALATAPVVRQDLTTREEWAGTLGYGDSVAVVAGREGVLTWLPDEGTSIGLGDPIAEISGAATRLLLGDRPAWRRMAVGERDGPDIRQLNDNLAALGYAARDALPEEGFDWRTRDAVYRWQADLGVRVTGFLELGDVLFLPSPARIGTAEAQRGSWVAAGQTLAQATDTERVVTAHVDAARLGTLAEGAPVIVTLPDRTRLDAIVRSIGRVVAPPAEGPDARPTVEVAITPSGLPDGLDAAPVVVTVERVLAEDVLTVPVGALVAVTGGGYAVERITDAGSDLVTVAPGQFADGLVEITGALAEGDEVGVPQ